MFTPKLTHHFSIQISLYPIYIYIYNVGSDTHVCTAVIVWIYSKERLSEKIELLLERLVTEAKYLHIVWWGLLSQIILCVLEDCDMIHLYCSAIS